MIGLTLLATDPAVAVRNLDSQLKALTPVTVKAAKVILGWAQQVIDQARFVGSARGLPGGGQRDNVYWKLDWHAKELAKLTDLKATYVSGEDLKEWVRAAFREADAVGEGMTILDNTRAQILSDVAENLRELPSTAGKAIGSFAASAVEGLTGFPLWAWGAIGVGVLAVGGLVFWKMKK